MSQGAGANPLHTPSRGAAPSPLAAEVAALLDTALPALPPSVPGGIVLVRLAGGEEVRRGFGSRGARGHAPAPDEDTVFQVLSISKPVSAMGALRLAHAGVLDLDAPVVDLVRSWTLPADRAAGFDPRRITLRRLLCHAAGLNVHGYDWLEPGAPRPATAELLDGAGNPHKQLRVIAPPGIHALYSGGGYTLLQQVIEDVTGRPFARVMHDTVFAPLGMTRSTFDDSHPALASLATPHDGAGGPLPVRRAAAVACSGLNSTARDLTRFLGALSPADAGGPLPADLAAMMTGTQARDAQGRGWSAGFYMLEFERGTIFHHGGLKSGWWSQIDGVAGAGHSMVALTNGDASDEHVKPILAELRQLLLPAPAPAQPPPVAKT
jgi:CubicO group peptidase (beta-lactamase class C family)